MPSRTSVVRRAEQFVHLCLVDARLRRVEIGLPVLVAEAVQLDRAVQHLLRGFGVARRGERGEAIQRDTRAQQIGRSVVERVNRDEVAARDTVERTARAAERRQPKHADHHGQRDENDPH